MDGTFWLGVGIVGVLGVAAAFTVRRRSNDVRSTWIVLALSAVGLVLFAATYLLNR